MNVKVTTKVAVSDYESGEDYASLGDFTKQLINTFTDGTGSGQCDHAFIDDRTLAAGGNTEDLDLAGGLTARVDGSTLTFTKVKVLAVLASSDNTDPVEVGGASSNQFVGPLKDATDIASVPPGGIALFVHPGAGWTVTAGTGDILKVADSSTAGVTYTIIIVGVATVS